MVAKNTAPKATRAARTNKNKAAAPAAAQETLMLAHATQFIDAGDVALSELINGLGAPDEVIERPEPLDLQAETVSDEAGEAALSELMSSLDEPEENVLQAGGADRALCDLIDSLGSVPMKAKFDDATLDAAVSSAEATEASTHEATPDGAIDAGAIPTGNASDVVTPSVSAAEKTKRVPVPRKHYTDKTDRLKDKLGTSLGEYSILTLADAVNEDELAAKMEDTMIIIRGMSSKASNWAVKLVEYLAGKKSSMSEVTLRIFKLLEKDGFITTGATGNLYLDLISKPYSPGAARAMGGNNLAALSGLKIIQPDGKGRWVTNPDSLLAMKARGMLFSAPEAVAELGEPALEAEEPSEEATIPGRFEDIASIEALLLEDAPL